MSALPMHRPPSFALLVLVLGLVLSLGAAQYVHGTAQARAQHDFEASSRIVADMVARRMDSWSKVLHGVRVLLTSSDKLTRADFQRHAQQLELPQRHPGFVALQFVRHVPAAQKAAFEAAVRADTSLRPQGYPDFRIRPEGERPHYLVTDFIEPMAGNEALFGLDVATLPRRLKALEELRDSGLPAASGRLQLSQIPSDQPGMVLRQPVYRPAMPLDSVAERREAFVGVVAVLLRMDDFFEGTVGGELLRRLDLRVYDLGPATQAAQRPAVENLLYDSAAARPQVEAPRQALTQSIRLPVAERVWLLELRQRDSDAELAPVLVLFGGVLASLLLFRLLRLQSRLSRELASRVAARTAELAAANAALRASEQRLELALAGANLGLWDWNIATGTLAWNARWVAMRGCSAPDLLPSVATWRALVHPEDREGLRAALEAHLQGRTPAFEAEYRVGTGASPWRWVLDAGRVVERDAQGRPLRMAGTNLDISERKLAEEDRAARAAAERASRAKSEFLARTSHELRTPLNAILGFAQMMQLDRQAPLPAAQAPRLQQIQGAGEHLLTMINEMLDLTAIEAGSVRLVLAPVTLAPLVAACLQALEPLARAAQVSLHADIADPALAVQADATRLREVLFNLLSNAAKYNRPGGWVRLTARAAGAARVSVAVEDCGAGLSDAQLGQLFQPFNRLGAERSGIEGTGLGLVIAQRLARLMHGSLQAARREQGGSVFTLELPVAMPLSLSSEVVQEATVVPAPTEAKAALVTALPAGPEAATRMESTAAAPVPALACSEAVPATVSAPDAAPGPALVLYIEDEPVNALLVRHILSLRPDCELRVADTGGAGIALARQQRPALVLIDLNLPDMSGHEVLAALRADPATRGLRCVALTADAMPESMERARACGFDAFWSKPIEVHAFLHGLDEQLALARDAVPA
ncbi:hybrid sensor histidine kinase/response regulator [Azohydromonas caseinilytica]|uniref:histidine kinase n=1 Tax=Azohydromonas caseinilytica TaxID=2728836 RepID=A0A848FEK3_9BURK|nr:CHASE domain-containing protein [Azohydromonas caseinilytica]NML17722.1 PAS domain-containing protein [Azohydromonas caseinilytica]